MVRALAPTELVCINVTGDRMEEDVRRRLAAAGVDVDRRVRFHPIPTDDAWIRDHGPIVVVGEGEPGQRARALVDFRFDAWGRKYAPFDRDDAVPRGIADALGLPRFEAPVVLEGGSVEGNGRGTVLTTESCLLNPNRGPGRTREAMERWLHDYLGADHVLWLADGIAGDDTDGHIDDLTRFVNETTVVTVVEERRGDANQAPLAENLRRLRRMADQDGKPLSVVPLPMPPPVVVDGQRCPASYANFYLANGVALVPTFSVAEDARALAVLADLLPGRRLAPIPATHLVAGLGAVHCLTQQEPL
jgi:agmatine deiminase